MRGAWDWAVSLEALREGRVRWSLLPTARAGCYRVTVGLFDSVDGKLVGCKAKLEADWPNSSYATLEGLLFNLVVKLDAEMEKKPLQQ